MENETSENSENVDEFTDEEKAGLVLFAAAVLLVLIVKKCRKRRKTAKNRTS